MNKYSISIIPFITLACLSVLFCYPYIFTRFSTDDFNHLLQVQENGSFLIDSFTNKCAFNPYYRPMDRIIWGIGYKLFGLEYKGYNLIKLILFFMLIVFFYKSISLLTNTQFAYVSSILFFLHCANHLFCWISWLETISALAFFWCAVFYILKAESDSKTMYLFIIVISTVFSILSKESTWLPFIIIYGYNIWTNRNIYSARIIIFGVLLVAIVSLMLFSPSIVSRGIGSSSYALSFIPRNLSSHLSNMLSSGLPLSVISVLWAGVLYLMTKRFFLSISIFYGLSAILHIQGEAAPYLALIFILALLLFRLKYLLWYLLFMISFIPILPFYLCSNEYHYDAYAFLLLSLSAVGKYVYDGILIISGGFQPIISSMKRPLTFRTAIYAILLGIALLICIYDVVTVVMNSLEARKVRTLHMRVLTAYDAYLNSIAHLGKCLGKSIEREQITIAGPRGFPPNTGQAGHFMVALKMQSPQLTINYDVNAKADLGSFSLFPILAPFSINMRIFATDNEARSFINNIGTNLIRDGSFEDAESGTLPLSPVPHWGRYSLVADKEQKPYNRATSSTFPTLPPIFLEPGTYLFGGFYKPEYFEGKACFEIVDARGYTKGRWQSNSTGGTSDWTLLAGRLIATDKLTVIPRPVRLGDFTRGKLYIDDVFLVKLP